MSETHPEPGVGADADILKRMTTFVEQSEDPAPQAAPEKAEAPKAEGQVQELTPEDLTPESPEQPAVEDVFEIVHNGTQVKLSRAEAIEHARQGFDYTRKTQALAAERQRIEEAAARFQQVEQLVPLIAKQLGEVQALESQVKEYENVDWVRLAGSSDAQTYAQHRARFDTLNHALQKAQMGLQQAYGGAKQHLEATQQRQLQAEASRIPDLIPEWREPTKRAEGMQELVKHYAGLGVNPGTLNKKLDDAFSLSVAYKAMKYDRLVQAKAEKSKQVRNAPPVTKPGASQGSAKADNQQKLTERLRKTGDLQDAAALLLNRWN